MSSNSASARPRSVLIVDPSPLVGDALGAMVTRELGTEAVTKVVTLARARAAAGSVDLVIADLDLLARGFTNRQAADAELVSLRTVESRRARLQEKLGCEGRAALTRHAHEMGLGLDGWRATPIANGSGTPHWLASAASEAASPNLM
jgi:DNA-binding CsgD family transcriptional regulator